MITKFDDSGTVEGLRKSISELVENNNVEGIVVLAGNNPEFEPKKLNPLLQSIPKSLIGGVYTSIVYEQKVYSKGTIVAGLTKSIKSFVVDNLSDEDVYFDEVIEDLAGDISPEDNDTMFVFVDGYSTRVGSLVESLFNVFGINNNFIGGGAGYYHPEHEMKSKPCVFTNDGIFSDSAVLGLVNLESEVGVKHGWNKITDAFRVTETDGKAIKTLDWKPAFETYCNILKEHSGQKVTRENFFDIGKSYSLGLSRIGSDVIVREPIALDGSALIFTVPVPNESLVFVLNGNTETMVNAAREAADSCLASTSVIDNKALFLVDCVSRYYFQGTDFEKELKALAKNNIPMIGVLSIGEIANTGRNYIEMYNKTCVLGLING